MTRGIFKTRLELITAINDCQVYFSLVALAANRVHTSDDGCARPTVKRETAGSSAAFIAWWSIALCRCFGLMEKLLLITRFDAARAARGEMLAIEDVLEILSVPLLGIIPESDAVLRASNLGTPVTICSGDSPPARAYTAAARRLAGEDIKMMIPTDKKGFFNKLFGRRAA
jgi:hypothetical protein